MARRIKMTPTRAAQLRHVPPPPAPPTAEEIIDVVWGAVERDYDEQPAGTITVADVMAAKNILSDRAQNLIVAAQEAGTLERVGWLRFRGPSGMVKRKPLYRPKVRVE